MILRNLSHSLCPEGDWDAVCVDVIDDGVFQVSHPGGGMMDSRRWRIVFEVAELDDAGKPRQATYYGYGDNVQANKKFISDFVEPWLGRVLTPEEKGVDLNLQNFVGQQATIRVLHRRRSSGFIEARVIAIMSPKVENNMVPSPTYVRPAHNYGSQKPHKKIRGFPTK